MPINPVKVHGVCIDELEAFLEFQAKISKNNRTGQKCSALGAFSTSKHGKGYD
jgi:hypothetical protein